MIEHPPCSFRKAGKCIVCSQVETTKNRNTPLVRQQYFVLTNCDSRGLALHSLLTANVYDIKIICRLLRIYLKGR